MNRPALSLIVVLVAIIALLVALSTKEAPPCSPITGVQEAHDH